MRSGLKKKERVTMSLHALGLLEFYVIIMTCLMARPAAAPPRQPALRVHGGVAARHARHEPP